MTLRLLHLDDHLVAIDKPAGLLVHRTQLAAHEDEAALQRLRDQLGRPVWPVHRLDRGTSGVLLFALSADVASRLGAMFEQGGMDKRYRALVRGWPAEDAGLVDHPLARDPEQPSAGQVLLAAQTRWRVLQRHEWPIATQPGFATTRVALLEVEPLQGRRHHPPAPQAHRPPHPGRRDAWQGPAEPCRRGPPRPEPAVAACLATAADPPGERRGTAAGGAAGARLAANRLTTRHPNMA